MNPNEEIEYGPFHEWGDDWLHWNELYEAEKYIANYVYKRSLCRLVSKEKYGTLRYEMLVPPRWCWYMWNLWLYNRWCVLGRHVLKKAINKAVYRFPNVSKEILDDVWWRD